MLLKEFIYFNEKTNDISVDRRYDSSRDGSILKRSDTRKIRLTLKQINQLRMQSEAHEYEKESELGFVQQMYGQPVEAEQTT
jgi:hypothetical protein